MSFLEIIVLAAAVGPNQETKEPKILVEAKHSLEELLIPPAGLDGDLSAPRFAIACAKLIAEGRASVRATLKTAVAKELAGVMAFCIDPLTSNKVPPIDLVEQLADPSRRGKIDLAELRRRSMVTKETLGFGAEWQDAAIRGLAAFLEERAKAEVAAALLTDLKSTLCYVGTSTDAEHRNFARRLFPATCGLVAHSADFYDQPASWGVLRAAFEADLRSLPSALIGLVEEQLERTDPGKNIRDGLLSAISLGVCRREESRRSSLSPGSDSISPRPLPQPSTPLESSSQARKWRWSRIRSASS